MPSVRGGGRGKGEAGDLFWGFWGVGGGLHWGLFGGLLTLGVCWRFVVVVGGKERGEGGKGERGEGSWRIDDRWWMIDDR